MFLTRYFPQKTAKFLLFTTVGTLALMGCSQHTPVANVDSEIEQTAQNITYKHTTLDNLQAAYNGESNAHLMYLAFAKKAEEEGYQGAASLFKAAARAEEIHRDNHAKVIQEMGATPRNSINTPVVKSTPENLENAIKGESYEREEMYPEFIKQAQTEGKPKAVQTFIYASDAEAQHAQLYQQALQNLKTWKDAKEFYICPLSGATSITADQNSCSTADGTKQQLEKVS
ncbi:Rubrerythrin [Gloeothece citriformis PCC 7424]|uniref:Rubrerythrin n=1 Tax=Gloeothece citriformis (strain PCC 7424) TaxID=65393 RepID=B7KBL5_GLOC7|nr:rubrerythrin family protein [Gloeothece citriformis]ACK72993.1 Rubrerythrin [Gloeothece citriformis PCC 7424]